MKFLQKEYFALTDIGIATGYELNGWSSRGKISVLCSFLTGCGVHPSSYSIGPRGSFPVGKAAGA
jgi:hypothetical protein